MDTVHAETSEVQSRKRKQKQKECNRKVKFVENGLSYKIKKKTVKYEVMRLLIYVKFLF